MAAPSVVTKNESAPLSDISMRSFKINSLRNLNVANQCVNPDLIITNTNIDISSSTHRLVGECLDVALSDRRRQAETRSGNSVGKFRILNFETHLTSQQQ